ncbi:MAG: M50 family metallopeptidase [Lachnospiraceae bacterium]|nr:M50 family metallopeptidase [Lachnospiraceae bacterium]
MTIIKILAALIIFGIIILVHEFGHFIAAKACGVCVLEFSLGMGPRLFTIHGKETDYSLKLLPLGGSCQMKGEMDDDPEEAPDPDSFQNKAPWQRFLIIAAGPAFNFILSFIVAIILCTSIGSDLPVVDSVISGKPAEIAGILPGDRITKINSRNIKLYRELILYNSLHEGQQQEITVLRNGQKYKFSLVPEYDNQYGKYMIGISSSGNYVFPQNVFETLKYSYYELRYNVLLALDSLIYLINGHFSPDNVMGPVGIISNISETVEETIPYGIKILLLTVADYILLFGTNVGVFNLIPFPALDGGRLLLIIIEIIIGKPVNRKVENYINFIGFALLMVFMLIISINDIGRLL